MADVVNNSNATTSAEVQQYLWNSLSELRQNVTNFSGQDWWLKVTTSFETSVGTATYTLTAGGSPFFQTRGVDVKIGSVTWTPACPYAFSERNKYTENPSYPYWNPIVQYRISSAPTLVSGTLTVVSTKLHLIPVPASVYKVRVWYVPDIDFSSVTAYSGMPPLWDEYMVVDSACKVLERDEQDTSQLMNRRHRIEETILKQAGDRDIGFPEKVQDVSRFYEP